jgi:BirA family biotin operon repressor/biotin-[acetyl-CoA-carboxylase] ligase
MVVWADFQTAGRGQGSNRWESERGKNLLFSMLLHPYGVRAHRQFRISMAISLAICKALGQHIGHLSIKWPNDIYWRDGKIGGILIENTLQGNSVKDCIIGIGLNVNQRVFLSNAPNPVSLWQISEQETDCEQLLHDILEAFQDYLGKYNNDEYLSMLYRRKGFHPYSDKDGPFMAELVDVEDSGHLLLRDDDGKERRYAFKEVTFIQ